MSAETPKRIDVQYTDEAPTPIRWTKRAKTIGVAGVAGALTAVAFSSGNPVGAAVNRGVEFGVTVVDHIPGVDVAYPEDNEGPDGGSPDQVTPTPGSAEKDSPQPDKNGTVLIPPVSGVTLIVSFLPGFDPLITRGSFNSVSQRSIYPYIAFCPQGQQSCG